MPCQLRHTPRTGHWHTSERHKGLRSLRSSPWAPAEKKSVSQPGHGRAGCGKLARVGAAPAPHPPFLAPTRAGGRALGRAGRRGGEGEPRAGSRPESGADAHPRGGSAAVPSGAPRPLRTRCAHTESAAAEPRARFRFPRVTSSNNSARQSCPGRSRGGGGGLGLPAAAPSLGLSACPRRRAPLGGGPGSSRRRLEPGWHR